MSDQGHDQRQSERITINREFGSIEVFIGEYVSNISRSGVFIKSKNPLPVGTLVNLRFSVILDEIETVEGIGKVVRVQADPTKGPTGMGVVFVKLTNYSQRLIERLFAPYPG